MAAKTVTRRDHAFSAQEEKASHFAQMLTTRMTEGHHQAERFLQHLASSAAKMQRGDVHPCLAIGSYSHLPFDNPRAGHCTQISDQLSPQNRFLALPLGAVSAKPAAETKILNKGKSGC